MTTLTCDFAKLQAGLALAASSVTETAVPPVDPEEPPVDPPPQHTPPVAFGDAIQVTQGQSGTLDLLVNDVLGDAPIASVRLVEPAARLTATLSERGVLSYAASASTAAGPDQLTYTITDDNGLTSNLATVAITVRAVTPPPVDPPPAMAMKLTGFHPAKGTNGGVPVDTIASLTGCDAQLRPRNPSQIVGLWPLMERWNLFRPGRGMPTNIFQRLTDVGQIALLTMPTLVRDPVDNAGKGGQGNGTTTFADWDSVVRGSNNSFYDAMLEWIEAQGQGHCRIRIGHEQGSEGWFPHSIGRIPTPDVSRRDFSAVKAGTEYLMRYVKRALPNCHIVYSHFWQPHTKTSPTAKVYYHPDEFAPRPEYYDIGSVDWYDGKGQPMTAANVDAMENQTHTIAQFGNRKCPWGVIAWEKYFQSLSKPFAVCEWGIMCTGPDTPERDNPFFIQRMHDHTNNRGWAHSCYFNPHDRNGAHRIKDGTLAGTRKSTDKYIQLYRG